MRNLLVSLGYGVQLWNELLPFSRRSQRSATDQCKDCDHFCKMSCRLRRQGPPSVSLYFYACVVSCDLLFYVWLSIFSEMRRPTKFETRKLIYHDLFCFQIYLPTQHGWWTVPTLAHLFSSMQAE